MKYALESGKKITIPDEIIQASMKSLGLTKEEAIQVFLEDEGIMENEEQQALETKAKDSKVTQTIHGAEKDKTKEKKPRKAPTRKENPVKRMIIEKVFELVKTFADSVEVTNQEKLIFFKIGDDSFELDLKQKRKKK